MCGIVGIVGDIPREIKVAKVRDMLMTLARRGPDGEGIEELGEAVLGHRRLAIFDVTPAGRQPMVSYDSDVGLIFNGAIYNFWELRDQLEARGKVFRTKTDTEVILKGYEEWGIRQLVSRLRGMFAFGIWDARKGKLFLVRDRLGVKPLVYAVGEQGELAFASTVRALRMGGFCEELNEGGVSEFLKWGFVTDDHSIYKGIVKVKPGTIVEWDSGQLESWTYWSCQSPEQVKKISFAEAVEQTEHLLLEAVFLRLRSDVPVGALLSGGIDSSLICWAIAKLGGNVKAYTVGVPGHPWDETSVAQHTAKTLGIKHRVLEMDEDELPNLQELSNAYGEPFASPSALAVLQVSRAMSSEVKVMLTGDGGDDCFLGYPRHRHLWLASRLSHMSSPYLRKLWFNARPRFPRYGPLRRVASFLDYAAGDLGAFVGGGYDSRGQNIEHIFGPRLKESQSTFGRKEWFVQDNQLLEKFLQFEHRGQFTGEYMTKIDGATMYYGMEARSPFLDYRLWEFAMALPVEIRLRRGCLKAILREVARRALGLRFALRPKTGFGIPVQQWMVGKWGQFVREVFQHSLAEEQGWISGNVARSWLDKSCTLGRAPNELWNVLVFDAWLTKERNDQPTLHC